MRRQTQVPEPAHCPIDLLIPIAQPKFTKTSMPDNPLLKVPPARRGNRTHAPHAVPLAKQGELAGGGQL